MKEQLRARNLALASLLTVGLLLVGGPADAIPCGGTASIVGNASTDDVALSGVAADECFVATGNAQGGPTGDPSLFSGEFGTGWQLLAKVTADPVQGAVGGALITVGLPAPSGTSGTWSVNSNHSILLDLVFAMHAGNRTGAFLFDDEALTANVTENGTWQIEWVNGGGNPPVYSNLTIFYRDPRLAVPIPGTLLLLVAAGLGGIGARRLRQTRR